MNLKFTEKPLAFAKVMLVAVKKWLPTPNAWQHQNAICVLPYFGIQWYKWQGETSKGCIRGQINCGWILWNASLMWKHNAH